MFPHEGQPVRQAGEQLGRARAAMVMVHGRGGSADDILTLSEELLLPGFAYVAPQAAGHTWYPNSFLAPIGSNQPFLDSALRRIESLVADLLNRGVAGERIALLGFSQGACLVTEFAARHPRRYGGVVAFSGGLIGPPGTPRDYAGSLDGTPVFLGCSDVDFHIPAERVRESADVMRRLGGDVTMRLYPGMGHLVNEDEIDAVRAMLAAAVAGG